MAVTAEYGLPIKVVGTGNTLGSAEVTLLGTTDELVSRLLTGTLPAGVLRDGDINGSIVIGALTISMGSGFAIIGDTAITRRCVQITASTNVTGLPANQATVYVWLAKAGTFTASQNIGDQPANSTLCCTCATNATEVTSVNNKPAGRVNIADFFQGTPTFTVGAEAANAINVSVQMKNAGAGNVAEKIIVEVWLSDTSGGAVTGTVPDTSVAIGTNGVIIKELDTKKLWLVATNTSGVFDLTITHTAARTWYLCVAWQGRLSVSSAVTFV